MVPYTHADIGKSENQIFYLLITPSFPSHDQDIIHKGFEFFETFIEPNDKVNPLVSQFDINAHNINIEYDSIQNIASSRDTFQLLSFTTHGSLYLDSLN